MTTPFTSVGATVLDAGRVRAELDGAVLTVTLDRPEARNAQTPATWRALAAIGDALPEDVRVVVLRGAGTSFSAGLDRAMLAPGGIPGSRASPTSSRPARSGPSRRSPSTSVRSPGGAAPTR
ncbi:hypothetical protein GCM10025864_36460 [Luteimicrobium album]|uniref:Enoyl-CoA hydratase/isomerase family protein n=1 Tax=Luteimicrobium album TaxID=1054550 RepID=A0ABQ6I5G6_9MICO|nr:enoyl-CoA hydratase/isomerase family protein [Luteimicrobium album]GMA25887.1 hypothetical protein GCM10025864_36460 [Luteimicrobium album]